MNKVFTTALALSLFSVSTLASTAFAFECESLGLEPSICAKAVACQTSTTCTQEAEDIYKAGKAAIDGDFGIKIDVLSGTEMVEIAATNGSTNAKQALPDTYNKLGNTYFFGERVMADTNKAVMWYKKAALAGHADAAYNLGCMYAWGEGVPESKAEAKKWLDMAVKNGNTAAEFVIKSL